MGNKEDFKAKSKYSFDLDYIELIKKDFNLTNYEAIMVFLKDCEVTAVMENNEVVFYSMLQELEDIGNNLRKLASKSWSSSGT